DRCSYISSIDAVPVSAVAPFEIDSVDKLKEFRAQAATLNSPVKFTADIDLTGETEPWTPIEGYGGTNVVEYIDGGGHKIIGLTAPLFGTTSASIYNLHLEDVNIGYYKNTTYKVDGKNDFAVMGALVCLLDDKNAIIEKCSASGKITINETSTIFCYVGGLIGCSLSTHTFSDLVNKVNFEVSGTLTNSTYIAGCVSYAAGSLDNCRNLGNFTAKPTGGSAYILAISGITAECLDIANCTNGDSKDTENLYGNITVAGKPNKCQYCSGIASYVARNIENCYNYGDIDISGEQSVGEVLCAAGIFNVGKNNKFVSAKNCENYGSIAVSQTTKNKNVFVTGICSSIYNLPSVSDCKNYGNITHSGTSGSSLYISGISSVTVESKLKNLYNYGNVTANGKANNIFCGGIIGRHSGIKMFSGDIINEGIILVDKNTNVTGSAYIGGVFGGCTSSGGTIEGGNIYSRGPIIVEKDAKAANMYIGGVIGSLAEATSLNPKIIGVKSACEILADGRSNIGMIIGTERDSSNPMVYDCRVGGLFWKSNSAQGEAESYSPAMLDATNHHKYIYGSGKDTNWTGAIRYDGNIFDSSLEAIPTPNKYLGLEE
ncbi:MAG: hypothetical protein IKA04_02065, partial [Alistipes sp.]|nr:hypothetical protein [Alistipes sp.]